MIISIANQKGGVGKTTTAVTLAAGFARDGNRVLLIDLDSQGNIAISLGMDLGNELYRGLMPGIQEKIQHLSRQTSNKNLSVIRSDKSTAALKLALSSMDFREYVLSEFLKGYSYDIVIIDSAPSLDILQTAALVASDFLIIPTQLDQLAVQGVVDVIVSLQKIKAHSSSQCEVLGVLPTFYDRVTNESHSQLTHLAESFGKLVLPPIPMDVHCREAPRFGKTLWEYSPSTRAIKGIEINGKNVGGYENVLNYLKGEIL